MNVMLNWEPLEEVDCFKKYLCGRVDDLSFFEYLSPICFFINIISLYFYHSYKILPYFVYYYSILIRMC